MSDKTNNSEKRKIFILKFDDVKNKPAVGQFRVPTTLTYFKTRLSAKSKEFYLDEI